MAAVAALGGCNMVVTDAPLFTAADAGKTPPFRPGVWVGDHPDCAFDESQPQTKWPQCADPVGPMAGPPIWLAVAGDPDLLQLPLGKVLHTEGGGVIYMAFRPLKLDDQGRAVEIELWPVLCGPPPAADKPGLTKQLSAGLQPRSDKDNCTTNSPQVLRATAKASEVWSLKNGKPARSRWLRDPMPGDLPPPPS